MSRLRLPTTQVTSCVSCPMCTNDGCEFAHFLAYEHGIETGDIVTSVIRVPRDCPARTYSFTVEFPEVEE